MLLNEHLVNPVKFPAIFIFGNKKPRSYAGFWPLVGGPCWSRTSDRSIMSREL